MEPSSQLATLTGRLYEAMTKGDHASFMRQFSKEDGTLLIGTDPKEWWVGHDTISRVVKAQFEEMGGGFTVSGNPRGYAEGTTGWVVDQPTITLPNGSKAKFRATFVLHREAADWKIVVWHLSAGVPNEELFGKTLTTR